jgi:hypothetical protein
LRPSAREKRKLPPGQHATVFTSEPAYIGLDTYDVLQQRVVSHHFRFGTGRQALLFRSPHRYIWPSELDLMAQLAGFELEARHADCAGAEFTADSRSHVSVLALSPAGRLRACRRERQAPFCCRLPLFALGESEPRAAIAAELAHP